MGDFDEQIAWLKKRRELALEDIAAIDDGRRIEINGADVTDKHRARAQEDADRFFALIAAYESQNTG